VFTIDFTSSDFEHARYKAFWNKIIDILTFHQNDLVDLEETLAQCPLTSQSDLGIRAVPVAQIVGSVGRSRDFDRSFMPRKRHTRDRWHKVDRAYYKDIALPPIELEQVGDSYFVVDGNHRVSVAQIHGQTYTDAHVIQLRTECDFHPSNQES